MLNLSLSSATEKVVSKRLEHAQKAQFKSSTRQHTESSVDSAYSYSDTPCQVERDATHPTHCSSHRELST